MTITERENLLRVANGLEPAWVPRKGLFPFANDPEKHPTPCILARAQVHPPQRGPSGGRIDEFGVEYEGVDSIGGAELPKPNTFILDDITKWRDVIKAPSLDDIPWREIGEKATDHIDKTQSCVGYQTHIGYFQSLMNFMGFSEGLVALAEEPEECMALFEYLADYYETIYKNLLPYIRPDFLTITDDTATARSPFVSKEMYRKMIMPYHARLAKVASDHDCIIEMHNCGRCEDFIDDWIEFGVKFWNPAQVMNDLVGIKKKYGNKFVLNGCWDSQGPPGWIGASEEVVRQAVRDCIDTFAPGGGFVFWASFYGAADDPAFIDHSFWITDEYNKYGRPWYKKQG